MSLHFPLPKVRTFRFSLHTSRLSLHGQVTIVALKFAMSSHFPLPKIFALFVPPLSNGTSRTTSDRKPKTNDQILPSPILFFPLKNWIKLILENASIVGRALDGTLRFRRWKQEVVPFRGDVKNLWLLAKQCTVMQWWQGPVERRRKWWPPWVLTRPFRRWGFDSSHWLFSQCLSCTFSEHCRKKSVRSTATKVESWISDANRRSLVSERRIKKDRTLVALVSERRVKDRTLVEKFQIVLSQLRAAEHPIQLVKKQKTGLMHRPHDPFERKSSSIKAKVEVRDLRGILVGSSWAQSQAVGRSIYIIGSAEALPILCVRYNRWERERDGSSETEVVRRK